MTLAGNPWEISSRTELERIGFNVIKQYGDLNKANTVVTGSNPQDFQWHLYTEAYAGTSAFVKYNPVVTSQMYAPVLGQHARRPEPCLLELSEL